MSTDIKKIFNWNRNNDNLILLLLFTFICVYYLPAVISWIVFLFYIFISYKTKNNYFWIAFYFILFDAPGRLFMPAGSRYIIGIPNYGFPGMALLFSELLILAYLIKALKQNESFKFIFKKDLIFLSLYFLVTVLISFLFGISKSNIIELARLSFPLALFYFLPKLLPDEESIVKLDRLLFPIIYVAFISQIHTFFSGKYWVDFFSGATSVDPQILLAGGEDAARVYDSTYLILYTTHKALFYIFSKKEYFSKYYLISIILISFTSIVLSATRGWVIAFAVVLFLTLLKFVRLGNIFRIGKIFVFSSLFFVILVYLSPTIKSQLYSSFTRLSTVNELLSGDLSAGGTSIRISERGPRVMSKFNEQPILGWGFSDEYFAYRDNHVGHHTLLLNVGIVGYVIFLIVFFKWLLYIYLYANNCAVKIIYGRSNIIFAFSMIFIFIIHSTSHQYWGFTLGGKLSTYIAFILLIISFNNNLKFVYENSHHT